MQSVRRVAYTLLRNLGIQVWRYRDPYVDAAHYLADTPVRAVVDGGAYQGATVRHMLRAFPEATVHAFEPQREEHRRLQDEFKSEARVRLYPKALSDNSGTATLHVMEKAYTTSLLPALPGSGITPSGAESVAITTLDEWCLEQGDAEIAFLKLDLQGHELQALLGARQLLSGSVRGVLTEVNFVPRYEGQCFFHEVATLLHQSGLFLYRLYELHPSKDGGWRQADALFLRRATKEQPSRSSREEGGDGRHGS